jgi:hypothetical protein
MKMFTFLDPLLPPLSDMGSGELSGFINIKNVILEPDRATLAPACKCR